MQKIHFDTEYEVKFCALEQSVAYTEPISGIQKFINQRKRWVSKVPFYRNKLLLPVLVMLYLFYLTGLISLFVSFFNQRVACAFINIFVLKSLIDFVFMLRGYSLLELSKNISNILKLLILFPVAEVFHLFYISIVPILSQLTGFQWKGRSFKR
jgi:cellulose synthase/poly-beta-1,6-N-acetylglucosamine synthase-like glycosyltransferase